MRESIYADSDFFLGLLKDSDWLQQRAREVYLEYRGSIKVTPFTVVEVLIVCQREGISLHETLLAMSRMVELEGSSWDVFFRASSFVEQGATIFDSLLMASCGDEGKIISSDRVYKKFGFGVIGLRERG